MVNAFRPMKHWHREVPIDTQRALFEAMPDRFFYRGLSSACEKSGYDSPGRLADKLLQRWRKAELVKYGDGAWYKAAT